PGYQQTRQHPVAAGGQWCPAGCPWWGSEDSGCIDAMDEVLGISALSRNGLHVVSRVWPCLDRGLPSASPSRGRREPHAPRRTPLRAAESAELLQGRT